MIVIAADKQQAEYMRWMARVLEQLSEHEVQGIALAALCEDAN